ncbi:MAG: ABC transporter ATP-binding protein [Eubacteriales bacterium]|nr:ABC transporter ATP-binding protein [Eubacteriales bacterium]
MKELIKLENISKKYDGRLILDHATLSVYENQSVAFTGHNGSGKSTILKILAGLVNPTEGKVIYNGRLLFHYVPERFPKTNLTAGRYLKIMGEIDGLSPSEIQDRCGKLCKDFFLEDMLNTSMKNLSKGTLQKIGVIQALLKPPQILLLDEPLSGQDADSQQVFIRKINQLRKENVTILMSCHEPYLIKSISDTLYVMEHGKPIKSEIRDDSSELPDLLFQKHGKESENERTY